MPAFSESVNQELQKKIQEAFEVFDHEHNNTVDVREIGTIIRSLGEKISIPIWMNIHR